MLFIFFALLNKKIIIFVDTFDVEAVILRFMGSIKIKFLIE